LQHFALTHQGLKRPSNQDRHLLLDLPDGRVLAAVADGMGGVVGGEVAAQMAVDLLGRSMDQPPQDHRALGKLFTAICRRVHEKGLSRPELEGMGTTLTAVVASAGRVDWAHVGDSRLYRWHNGRLAQVTRDHTAAAFMAEEGMISTDEAGSHPARHVLFDCVGCGECDPDTGWFHPEPEEAPLLTSDGLHDKVTPLNINRVLASRKGLPECLVELLDLALKTGGSDNITVVGVELP